MSKDLLKWFCRSNKGQRYSKKHAKKDLKVYFPFLAVATNTHKNKLQNYTVFWLLLLPLLLLASSADSAAAVTSNIFFRFSCKVNKNTICGIKKLICKEEQKDYFIGGKLGTSFYIFGFLCSSFQNIFYSGSVFAHVWGNISEPKQLKN